MKHQYEIERIEQFIIERTNTVDGVVVGVSGGLDSAIVAALCVRALGKNRVKLVHIPELMDKIDKDAVKLASNLGMRMPVVLIQNIVECFQFHSPDSFNTDLGIGNLKARIRMSVLYGYSNEHNLLVAGTTNYSEWLTGYFTKYGDGGIDFEPLLHLFKTELYELAEYFPEIPKEIIEKEPTAGLWSGQTDEEELGMTYAELDAGLKRYLNDDPVEPRIMALIRGSKHKRISIPNLLGVNQ